MIELKGEIIVLKALKREDCFALWEQTEEDLDMSTEFFNPGLAPENADKWFNDMQAKQGQSSFDLGVFDSAKNVIGHIQLHSINWRARSAELGLGLAKKSNRGKGYGTDASKVLVRYGFDHLGLHRIFANPVEFNQPAIRVLEKSGFSLEGREREAFFLRGHWYDRVVFSILEHEFREKSSSK